MLNILLQAFGANGQIINLLFIGGLIIVFYFFMVRPQQKKQKDQKSFTDSLKKGDKVVTVGGIHGKVIEVEGSTLMIEIAKGIQVKCEKYAVSYEPSKALQQVSSDKTEAIVNK